MVATTWTRTRTMSGTPGKAIASLAKIPTPDTTRAGTQKMKFIPTLPMRRKKECVRPRPILSSYLVHDRSFREVKQVSASASGRNGPYCSLTKPIHRNRQQHPHQLLQALPLSVPAAVKGAVEGAATRQGVAAALRPRALLHRR